MLEEIEKQKAAKASTGSVSAAPDFVRMASSGVPPPPPGAPPPPGGGGAPPPPPDAPPDVSDAATADLQAQMSRLTTEQEATLRSRGSEMDTL